MISKGQKGCGRMRQAAWTLPLLSVLLGGCVSLGVKNRDQFGSDDPAARVGVEYRLAFTQMKGKVIWRLAKCQGPEIAIKTEGVTVGSAPDMARRYVIDMTSLSSPMKTSNLKVERWPGGHLKSINATAEDRSAQVIGSLISSAVKLFTPVPSLGGADRGALPNLCAPEAAEALANVGRLKEQVAASTNDVKAGTAGVDAILERIRLAGGVADTATANALGNAVANLETARKEQAALQAKLEKALGDITAEAEFLWPRSASDAGPNLIPMPAAAGNWFLLHLRGELRRGGCVQLWLSRTSGGGAGDVDTPDEATLAGVRYRDSEPGLFEVRATADPPEAESDSAPECISTPGSKLVLSMPIDVLQFGRVMTLPFRNAMFQNNGLEAAWDEQGRLTSVGYGVKSASAETVATLLGSGIDTVRSGIAAERAEENKRLTQENARLEAQIKNAELRGKLNPPAADEAAQRLANFDADRQMAEAEAAAINAEIALQRARAEKDALGID